MVETMISSLVEDLKLSVLAGEEWLDNKVVTPDISRPALEVGGYFTHYPAERIQVFGNTELDFFAGLDVSTQQQRAATLMTNETPCLIFARGRAAPQTLIAQSSITKLPLLGSGLSTTRLISRLGHWLDNALAPRTTIHGVFMDLFGVGVLLTGASGIGKSETALELIKKGHRLIADDAVEIRKPSEEILVGTCPPVLKNLLELRGLGIIDVTSMFGAGVVRPSKRVEVILNFESWHAEKAYDRLGFELQYREILDVNIPWVNIPVAPGRNLAMLVETAAINHRAKSMGSDVGQVLNKRIDREMRT